VTSRDVGVDVAPPAGQPATGRVFLHSRGGFRWRYRVGSTNMAMRLRGMSDRCCLTGWFTFVRQASSRYRKRTEKTAPIDCWGGIDDFAEFMFPESRVFQCISYIFYMFLYIFKTCGTLRYLNFRGRMTD